MKKSILKLAAVIAVFIVVIIACRPANKLPLLARRCTFNDNLIGSIYSGNCMSPPGPRGKTFTFLGSSYSYMGGSLISDPYVEPIYSLTIFQKKGTHEYLLFLEKKIGRDDNHAIWLVLDILKIPVIKSTERLMFGMYECKLDGKFDNEIVAIAKDEEVLELVNIIKAWRANTAKEKFEEISLAGTTCEQECVGDGCD